MNVLVVGGTGFLGSALVEDAVAGGHDVTVFTRGRTGRTLPAPVKILTGDRHRDLSALRGRRFDLVVDTCAFAPDDVALLLDALSPDIGRYAFVSSASVYSEFSRPGIDEDAPSSRATAEQLTFARTLPPDQRSGADAYGEAYGPLKREAEIVALERLGGRALVLRSGLLVGAGDYTDRLTYWVRRIDQGGRVAAPGDPRRLVQLIDARDAAAFIIAAAARGIGGIFNLTGEPLAMEALLQTIRMAAGSDARFEWRRDDAIIVAGLEPWTEVPLWLPESDGKFRRFLEISVAKAISNGLRLRPLAETLRNILDWDRTRRTAALKAGMPPAKEALLLSSA